MKKSTWKVSARGASLSLSMSWSPTRTYLHGTSPPSSDWLPTCPWLDCWLLQTHSGPRSGSTWRRLHQHSSFSLLVGDDRPPAVVVTVTSHHGYYPGVRVHLKNKCSFWSSYVSWPTFASAPLTILVLSEAADSPQVQESSILTCRKEFRRNSLDY